VEEEAADIAAVAVVAVVVEAAADGDKHSMRKKK